MYQNMKRDRIIQKKSMEQRLTELPLLLLIGGVGYLGIELAFRGWSHWSMMLCGAVCFWLLYRLNERMCNSFLLLRAALGALIITGIELAAGIVFNLLLGWQIWDYSQLPYQLLGQICLPFTLLWFCLCIPVCGLCYCIRRVVFFADE